MSLKRGDRPWPTEPPSTLPTPCARNTAPLQHRSLLVPLAKAAAEAQGRPQHAAACPELPPQPWRGAREATDVAMAPYFWRTASATSRAVLSAMGGLLFLKTFNLKTFTAEPQRSLRDFLLCGFRGRWAPVYMAKRIYDCSQA